MLNDSYRYKNLIRVRKNVARKLWCQKEIVFLLPCNLRVDNPWQPPYGVSGNEYTEEEFNKVCNGYSYYNCDKERGKYLHFYVEEGQQ